MTTILPDKTEQLAVRVQACIDLIRSETVGEISMHFHELAQVLEDALAALSAPAKKKSATAAAATSASNS